MDTTHITHITNKNQISAFPPIECRITSVCFVVLLMSATALTNLPPIQARKFIQITWTCTVIYCFVELLLYLPNIGSRRTYNHRTWTQPADMTQYSLPSFFIRPQPVASGRQEPHGRSDQNRFGHASTPAPSRPAPTVNGGRQEPHGRSDQNRFGHASTPTASRPPPTGNGGHQKPHDRSDQNRFGSRRR